MVIDGSHDPQVLDKSAECIADLSPMNYVGEAQAIWAYVRGAVRYVDDPTGDDMFQAPAVTMRRRAGDCDDQVILLASLLRSVGFQVRICFIFRNPPQDLNVDFPEHVYAEVNINKNGDVPNWVACETIPMPGDRGGFVYSQFGASYPHGYKEYFPVD